jgi:hypothetical protein
MHEFEARASEVSRRILPHEPAESRLFCDLQALTVVLLREIDRRQKNTESEKGDTDWPVILTRSLPRGQTETTPYGPLSAAFPQRCRGFGKH